MRNAGSCGEKRRHSHPPCGYPVPATFYASVYRPRCKNPVRATLCSHVYANRSDSVTRQDAQLAMSLVTRPDFSRSPLRESATSPVMLPAHHKGDCGGHCRASATVVAKEVNVKGCDQCLPIEGPCFPQGKRFYSSLMQPFAKALFGHLMIDAVARVELPQTFVNFLAERECSPDVGNRRVVGQPLEHVDHRLLRRHATQSSKEPTPMG